MRFGTRAARPVVPARIEAVEPFEQRGGAVEQPRQCGRVARFRRRLDLGDVGGVARAVERDALAARHQQRRFATRERLQLHEALAEARARLCLAALAPQQPGEPVAIDRAAAKGEVREERTVLAAGGSQVGARAVLERERAAGGCDTPARFDSVTPDPRGSSLSAGAPAVARQLRRRPESFKAATVCAGASSPSSSQSCAGKR